MEVLKKVKGSCNPAEGTRFRRSSYNFAFWLAGDPPSVIALTPAPGSVLSPRYLPPKGKVRDTLVTLPTSFPLIQLHRSNIPALHESHYHVSGLHSITTTTAIAADGIFREALYVRASPTRLEGTLPPCAYEIVPVHLRCRFPRGCTQDEDIESLWTGGLRRPFCAIDRRARWTPARRPRRPTTLATL